MDERGMWSGVSLYNSTSDKMQKEMSLQRGGNKACEMVSSPVGSQMVTNE